MGRADAPQPPARPMHKAPRSSTLQSSEGEAEPDPWSRAGDPPLPWSPRRDVTGVNRSDVDSKSPSIKQRTDVRGQDFAATVETETQGATAAILSPAAAPE